MPELNFKGKEFVRNHHLSVPHRPLQPDAEKSVGTARLDGNLIIHGDNLHALKSLLPMYAGKVNCVYIDPPYNTGNEGWCYNDNGNSPQMQEWLKHNPVGIEDGLRHDKWCTMMWPRLVLLRELLAEDGVIFISIDDNEQHRLRMMMDEIFGEDNFVSVLHVEMSTTQGMKVASAQKGKIVKNGEFIFIYNKHKEPVMPFNLLYETKNWDTHYSIYYESSKGTRYSLNNFLQEKYQNTKCIGTDKIGKLYSDDDGFRDFIHKNANNIYQDAMCEINFSLSQGQEKALTERKIIKCQTSKKSYLIFRNSNGIIRQLLSLKEALGDTNDFIPRYGLRKIRGDWWKDYYKDMMNVAKEGQTPFKNGKKPIRLIKDLLKLVSKKNAIIIDSFAGSGTTAHAMLALNKEDGGKRKFILVEGEDYADNITAERVRRVIKGVKTAKDKNLQEGLGGEFTYCELGDALDMDKLLTGETMPNFVDLGTLLFHTATNQVIDPARIDATTGYLGTVQDYHLWLIYKPDLAFLKSNEAALTLDKAKEVAKKKRGEKRHLVFAPATFVSKKTLDSANNGKGIAVDYQPLPWSLYRVAGS